MTKRLLLLFVAIACAKASLFAQKPAAGTLTVDRKNFSFNYGAAYETKNEDSEATIVVLSGQKIADDKLKDAIEAAKNGEDSNFKHPFLKLEFNKVGQLQHWSAGAGNTTLGNRGAENVTAEVRADGGHAIGKASKSMDSEGMFPTAFDVQFDLPLLKNGEVPAAAAKTRAPAANIKPTVSGTFKGNGKDAKIAFVSARWGEPFDDKPGIVLVFTEKDHSQNKKPDFDASFGKFGSALIISLHEDGQIYGCQVVHTAHKKQGFSSIGSIRTNNFEYADGKVEGELLTDGEVDVFGEKWSVDLKFAAPLGEVPAELQPKAKNEPVGKTMNSRAKPTPAGDDQSDAAEAKTSNSGIKAKDLPLPKDASGVEYKALVQQLTFKSAGGVKPVASELSANLKAQGWTNDGSDLITPASAILKRKHGAASLTIFVKPDGAGTEVKMMTEGLDWD